MKPKNIYEVSIIAHMARKIEYVVPQGSNFSVSYYIDVREAISFIEKIPIDEFDNWRISPYSKDKFFEFANPSMNRNYLIMYM